jgi:hypothetical protein
LLEHQTCNQSKQTRIKGAASVTSAMMFHVSKAIPTKMKLRWYKTKYCILTRRGSCLPKSSREKILLPHATSINALQPMQGEPYLKNSGISRARNKLPHVCLDGWTITYKEFQPRERKRSKKQADGMMHEKVDSQEHQSSNPFQPCLVFPQGSSSNLQGQVQPQLVDSEVEANQ